MLLFSITLSILLIARCNAEDKLTVDNNPIPTIDNKTENVKLEEPIDNKTENKLQEPIDNEAENKLQELINNKAENVKLQEPANNLPLNDLLIPNESDNEKNMRMPYGIIHKTFEGDKQRIGNNYIQETDEKSPFLNKLLSYETPSNSLYEFCNNPEMYEYAPLNNYEDDKKEPMYPFISVMHRIKTFTTLPNEKEEEPSKAREAEADPHFHFQKKVILHNNFNHGTFQHTIHNAHSTSFVPTYSSHIPVNTFTPHINSGHHESLITINKQHNNFLNHGLPQNIQIAQSSGHNNDFNQFQRSLPFSVNQERVSRPYLIDVSRQHMRFDRSTNGIKDRTYRTMEMILNKEAEFMKQAKEATKRKRRAIPLVHLIADPNKKLDVEKTLENIGTITRQSFHNRRAPMYHLRNMLGSAHDVVLSAFKAAPQDLIIPSRYKIIDKSGPEYEAILKSEQVKETNSLEKNTEEIPNPIKKLTLIERIRQNRFNLKPRFSSSQNDFYSKNPNEFMDFVGTFQKVGTVLRDSIKSGQATLKHMGDVAHSARKVLTTAKYSAPTVLLPYAKAPALLSRSQFDENEPDKVMLVAPRILQIEEDSNEPHPADNEEEFVQVGDIMNALGLAPSNERKINLTKVVLHHKMTPAPPILESRFQSRSNLESEIVNNSRPFFMVADDHEPYEEFSLNSRNNEIVGESPIEDFVLQMREEFDNIRNDVNDLKNQINESQTVQIKEESKTNKRATKVEEFFDKLRKITKKRERSNEFPNKVDENEDEYIKQQIKEIFGEPRNEEMVVGAGLPLGPELFKPFMGRPSEEELKLFLEENNDDLGLLKQLEDKNGEEIVGAINPFMYEKYFNERLKLNKDEKNSTTNENVVSMKMPKALMKPFLGKVDYDIIYDYEDGLNQPIYDEVFDGTYLNEK